MSNPPPSGGGEWDPSQGSETWRSTLDLESVLTVGIDVPVEGRRQMAEIDVAADPPLGPPPDGDEVSVGTRQRECSDQVIARDFLGKAWPT